MTNFAPVCGAMLVADFRLTLANSIWWYLLVAAAAVVLAFGVYRYTLPPVSRTRRSLLWALRGVALLLLILLLFEPVLNYIRRSLKPPIIALLVDRSASMNVTDGTRSRADDLRMLVASSPLRSLGGRSTLRAFAFADTTTEVKLDSLKTMPLTGVGTDLSGNWERAEKVLATENLAAIVLLSDGAYNLGENPARAAAASPVPIYAIGLGDTTEHTDAVISEMLTNDVTYSGSKVPLDVHVRAHGLSGKTGVVHLYGGGATEITRQNIQFAGDDAELSVSLSFQAGEPGDMRVTAALDSVPGESRVDNNRRSVIVKVLERKSRVLLFAGAPSPDLTVLRQTLQADTTIEVRSFVEIGGGRLAQGIAYPAAEDIGNANLIVLVDAPTGNTPQSLLDQISSVVSDRRIPFLFLAGPHVVGPRLSALSSVLPVHSSKQSLTEEVVTCRAAASHAALSGRSPLPAEWSDLPPVFGGAGNFTADPSAQVVVKISREALGVNEDEPGLVLWETGQRRGAAFLCWGTSRWKLQLAGTQAASAFYDELTTRIRAWLIAPAEEQRVKIRATKKLYTGGERVHFVAQVYGADLSPRDDASIELKAVSGTRSEAVPMLGRGNGRYEGDLSPWAEGDYHFSGAAVAGKDTLGSDRGMFTVEAFNVELIDTRARFDVLRQVTEASKGAFVPVSKADSLLSSLKFAPKSVSTHEEVSLWNRASMIWLIILLLAAEWIIRKRSGML
jgi:hypothetical protein